MDIQQLTAFIAVADSTSFSIAAEQLHLTQPAVSKRIAALEASLATKLFDRISKQIILTESGEILMPRARKVLLELNDIRRSIQNLTLQVSGKLSLASSHHIGLYRLAPVLKEFATLYPDVSIDISFFESEEAYRRVCHGDIELAVVTLSPEVMDRIQSHSVWNDPLSIMTSPDHELTNREVVRLKDLLDYPVVLPSESTFTRQLVEKLLNSKQLRLEVSTSTNNLETLKVLVSIGMAWSILPRTMMDDSLAVLPVKNGQLSRKLGYIYHKEHTLSNASKAFIQLLEK